MIRTKRNIADKIMKENVKTAGFLCGPEVKSKFSAFCTCYISAIFKYSLQFSL